MNTSSSLRRSVRVMLGTTVAGAILVGTAGVAVAGASTTSPARPGLEARRAQCISEIDRRVTALGKVQARIDGMARLTAEEKATQDANLGAVVTTLNTVNRPAVTAAATPATLAQACAGIYADVRVFAVVLPQIIDTVKIEAMQTFSAKLTERSAAKAAEGKDTTAPDALIAAANTSLTELTATVSAVTVAGFNADPAGTKATWESVSSQMWVNFGNLITASNQIAAL